MRFFASFRGGCFGALFWRIAGVVVLPSALRFAARGILIMKIGAMLRKDEEMCIGM